MLPCVADYTRERMGMYLIGQVQKYMPILISPLGTEMVNIGFYHRISTMKSSRTGEELFIMVNSARRPSIILE